MPHKKTGQTKLTGLKLRFSITGGITGQPPHPPGFYEAMLVLEVGGLSGEEGVFTAVSESKASEISGFTQLLRSDDRLLRLSFIKKYSVPIESDQISFSIRLRRKQNASIIHRIISLIHKEKKFRISVGA